MKRKFVSSQTLVPPKLAGRQIITGSVIMPTDKRSPINQLLLE